MVALPEGAIARSRALWDSGVRRTYEDRGHVLDLVPPPYIRPIDEELDRLLELPKQFPGLVRTRVIGHSVEGRPLIELHVSDFSDPRDKPTVSMLANIHGDEIGNGPWGMALMGDGILPGFGVDPAATAALRARSFRLVPYGNPDGRARVDQGFVTGDMKDLFHRTNAHHVDLNRNFPEGFSQTLSRRGKAGSRPLSEPETAAIAGWLRTHQPDLYADIHSKGDSILVPYGYDRSPSPMLAGLHRIAQGAAARNGYSVESSATFTRGGTSGTSKDWVHAEFGVPSFTVEVGQTHHMTQGEFDDAVMRNRPALSYLTRIADAPWERSKGPEVSAALRDARGGLQVSVTPDGLRHAVAGVEIYHDPFTAPGRGVALAGAGVRDAEAAGVTRWSVPPKDAAGVTNGVTGVGQLYARAVDSKGNWGPYTAVA